MKSYLANQYYLPTPQAYLSGAFFYASCFSFFVYKKLFILNFFKKIKKNLNFGKLLHAQIF